ncbi:hypothetical protein Tco_1553517 [Tanacetum coccineum]
MNFTNSSEYLQSIPSKSDLDNLFGPLFEEYYSTSLHEVLDDSATNTTDIDVDDEKAQDSDSRNEIVVSKCQRIVERLLRAETIWKGLPKIRGTLLSSSISRIIKSTKKYRVFARRVQEAVGCQRQFVLGWKKVFYVVDFKIEAASIGIVSKYEEEATGTLIRQGSLGFDEQGYKRSSIGGKYISTEVTGLTNANCLCLILPSVARIFLMLLVYVYAAKVSALRINTDYILKATVGMGKIVGNSRFDDTKETSNETKGLKCKAGILQKMEDFEDSKRSP